MAENRSSGNRKTQKGSASARERIENPQTGPSYVRRDDEGKFKEVENVGRSSRQDQQREAEHESRPGFGDRGDRAESPSNARDDD